MNSKEHLECALVWELVKSTNKGRKLAFTNGCFDIFHAGHVCLLRYIRCRYPDHVVVVGLNNDDSVRRLKGPERPVNRMADRFEVLRACRFVDEVLVFADDTPEALIRVLRPKVLVKDARYRGQFVAGAQFVLESGGVLDFVEPKPDCSTTGIIEKARRG